MATEVIDPEEVKATSERIILQAGGRVCDWLPLLDNPSPRSQADLIGRSLVLNALINIAFGAPIPIIRGWIAANGAMSHVSFNEQALLLKNADDLSEQEVLNLRWSLEALWALMWAGGLTDDLAIDGHVPDAMAMLVPDLQKNENGTKFSQKMQMRPVSDLYCMLDLYYRAHWSTEDGRINGYSTGDISPDVVMERRKALEWLLDASADWDHISLDT